MKDLSFKRLMILPLITLIFSSINVLPAFAALGDDWQGNASGLIESTSTWRGSEISSDGRTQGVFDDRELYISTDFGASWTKKFTTSINKILLDLEISQDGSKIIALTNGQFSSLQPLFHVSTDFGNTWIEKTNQAGTGEGFTQFALSADGLKIVTITNQFGANGKVYYSLNSGDTWNETISRPADENLSGQWRSIDISPDGTKIVASGGQTGIKISQDFGTTWSFVTAADPNVIWPKVSFVNNDGSWIMAGTAFWDNELGLIKLFVDDEDNFFDYLCFLDPQTPCDENGFGRPTVWSNFAVASDGLKSFGIGRASGTSEYSTSIYRSQDSGQIFSDTTLPVGRWTSISTDAAGTHLVATAWDKQIYVSSDSGINWTAKSTGQTPATYVWRDIEASSSGQYLYASKEDGDNIFKLFTSSDYGNTWREITPQGYSLDNNKSLAVSANGSKIVTVIPAASSDEFFGSCLNTTSESYDEEICNAKLLVSNNYGETWESKPADGQIQSSLAISSDGVTQIMNATAYDVYLEEEIYNAISIILVSRDSGITWVAKQTNIIESIPEEGDVRSVAISGDGQKMIAATNYTSNFIVSTNYGDTWSEVKNLPADTTFQDGSNIFISNDGSKVYALTNRGLFLSTDFGDEWVVLTDAPDGEAGCTDLKLNSDGSRIVLSCFSSVYYSENSGQNFQVIMTGQEFGNPLAVAASQDFSTVAIGSRRDVYVTHGDAFVPTPTTPPAPSGNNDSGPATSTPTPTAKPKIEEVKEKIRDAKEEVEVLKSGSIAIAEPLILRLIEDLPVILRPQIVNIFTETPVANQILDSNKVLNILKDIVDKILVDLPSLVKIDGEIQASRLVVVDNTTLQLVTADGGVLSVQANDGENPIPVDQSGKVQMVRSNGVETKGVGLSPNSEFSVYLFSDPTLLGIGKSDAQGNFNASFLIDKDFPLGNHTLQINGVLANGKTTSISMPVSVVESVELATTQAMTKVTQVNDSSQRSNNWIILLLISLVIIGYFVKKDGLKFIQEFTRGNKL